MSKIFSFNDKRNGSYIDLITGDVGVNTGTSKFSRTEKGIAWDGNGGVGSKVTITSVAYAVHTGTYSFEFWVKRKDLTTKAVLGSSVTGGSRSITLSSTNLSIESDTNGNTINGTSDT